jgi:hypothetical protein
MTLHADEVDIDEIKDVELMPVWSGDAFSKAVQYPVVVEMYDKVKERGSKQRAYHAEFDETERKIISKYYHKFYRWYLVSGHPRRIMMKIKTFHLLQRACNFFGTL